MSFDNKKHYKIN